MSSYTMQLRTMVERWSQTQNMSLTGRIEQGRTRLFDFDYPIFDKHYKRVFETHFIRHFYMREIGFETEELFKFRLENWLNINMPYFNKLFESELIVFNPLENINVKETEDKNKNKTEDQTAETNGDASGTAHQTNSGQATEDNFARHLSSDTPESRLTITTNDGEGVIEYASSIEENNDNNSKNTSSTSDGNTSQTSKVDSTANTTVAETEDYLNMKIGKVGNQTYSKMLTEYRETFLRIEKRIFDEINKQGLFMLVY